MCFGNEPSLIIMRTCLLGWDSTSVFHPAGERRERGAVSTAENWAVKDEQRCCCKWPCADIHFHFHSFFIHFHFHLEAGFKIFSDDSNENDTKTLTWTENILSVFKAKKKNHHFVQFLDMGFIEESSWHFFFTLSQCYLFYYNFNVTLSQRIALCILPKSWIKWTDLSRMRN